MYYESAIWRLKSVEIYLGISPMSVQHIDGFGLAVNYFMHEF